MAIAIPIASHLAQAAAVPIGGLGVLAVYAGCAVLTVITFSLFVKIVCDPGYREGK